ncbi:MAG: argininosuccinate lyase [Phycisphaerales bacterium]|nr:argininosuccinate lyase [Phycisphaerales bacterium]
MTTLWGGRFEGAADPLFRRFNDSLPFDHRLLRQDVEGSIAWAGAIAAAGVLTPDERDRLQAALRELLSEAEANPAAVLASGEEDVHSYVESRLVARVGPLGKKLHTGRSRNDQVATDLRLWLRERLGELLSLVRSAQAALLGLAEREQATPIPGYTHLQPAQPLLLAHWCLAYFEMLDRDAERFIDAFGRTNICPLGSGALAGTAYPIDRAKLAEGLGFDAPTANSLDAVASRDFALEALAASAICAAHLSRLAEDLIVYASAEFGLVTMADAFSSGSSLMPQKKNPDALELIRGKFGRILGAFTGLAVTLKGLPLAYNKDLQEDKEPLFDATEHLALCLRVLAPLLDTLIVNRDRCRVAAGAGFANATDLADYLVARGVPFRDAHDAAGRLVRAAIARSARLEDLPLAEMKSVCPAIEQDVFSRLTLEAVLARRDVPGGTAPARVAQALRDARARLSRAEEGGST